MLYNTLKDAVPIEWHKTIKTMRIPNELISAQQAAYLNIGKSPKEISKITNKKVYQILVRNIQAEPIIIEKLTEEFGIEKEKN